MLKIIINLLLLVPFALASQSSPNIIFFLADDLGHGEIGFNSSTYELATPAIDSLARNGAYFSNYYARSVCSPARAAFLTGRHPFRLTGNWDYRVNWPYDNIPHGIEPDWHTLPEYLKEHGYSTGHFGKWHMGCAIPQHAPNQNGFDYSYGTNFGFASQRDFQVQGFHNLTENNEKITPPAGSFESDLTSAAAFAWLDFQLADTTQPFFMYYAFTNPHDDFQGSDTIPYKAEYLAQAPAALSTYGKQKWASIADMNAIIDTIWQIVRDAGAENNTIIVFTSDNGADSSNAPDNSPFSGNKATNEEGAVRVPFVWYHLGTIDSMTVDSITCLEDMLPTFVEGVLGGNVLEEIDGVNFYSLLGGAGSFPSNRTWYGHYIAGRMWSVRRGKWKLTNNNKSSVASNSTLSDNIQLFDLYSDVTESTDVSGSNASVVAELQALIDAITPEATRASKTTPGTDWDIVRWFGDAWSMYESTYQHTQTDYKR